MDNYNSIHICLLAHCLYDNQSDPIVSHPELFIHISELDELFSQLSDKDFSFCLPSEIDFSSSNSCSMTFDDGYANNLLFLPLANKYELPFILFPCTFNIRNQLPFIWDIYGLKGVEWKFWKEDYLLAYQSLNTTDVNLLLSNNNYRPLTFKELLIISENRFSKLGLHTETHQPLVGSFLKNCKKEITINSHFLNQFSNILLNDLSLPCGLYTSETKRFLLENSIKRIYTIDGGFIDPGNKFIHRISLINPKIGGNLLSQIEKSFLLSSKIRRKIVNFRYSVPIFNF